MQHTRIQSIVAQMDAVVAAFVKDDKTELSKATAKLKADRNALLLAGLRDLAGHDRLVMQAQPAKDFDPEPLVITVLPEAGAGAAHPSFGTDLAKILNVAVPSDPFTQIVKETDHECVRSAKTIWSLLANMALDQRNGLPDEVLDPITSADMAAFAMPGGLLSSRNQGTPDSHLPQ